MERETPMILALMMTSEEGQEFPMHVVVTGVVRYPDSSGESVEDSLNGWGVPGDEVTDPNELIGAKIIGARAMDAGWIAQTDQDCAMLRDRMAEVLDNEDDGIDYTDEYIDENIAEVFAIKDGYAFARIPTSNEIRAIKIADLKSEVKIGDEIDLATVANEPTNQLGW